MPMPPHPPLLLQMESPTRSALESFLFGSQPGVSDPPPPSMETMLETIKRQVQAGDDYNRYLFSQYVMYRYIMIFVTPATSWIYRNHLVGVASAISDAVATGKVTDRALASFLRLYLAPFENPARDTDQSLAFCDALSVVQARLQPSLSYPGIDDLLRVIDVVHSKRPLHTPETMLYQTILRQIDGYDQPTLVLVPVGRSTLQTDPSIQTDTSYWTFVYSLNLPAKLQNPGDLSMAFYLLARLALPLDPIELTTRMSQALISNDKTGIPFCNYLAMYLKQRLLGMDYKLSRLADSRRILMQRLHQFCGVGATCVGDVVYARYFMDALGQVVETNETLSDADRMLFAFMNDSVTYTPTASALTRRLRYEAAIEAAMAAVKKQKKPAGDTDPPDPDNPDNTPDESEDDEDADPDAFATDPDTGKDPGDTTAPSPETDDNPIDQPGGNPTPITQAVSTILPLALPSETIDDHLFRLTLLQYVSHMNATPNPDIPPEALGVLNTWCESWLFLAAIKATKQLLAQLKLTGHLKEFAA
jgi:hypothetical protein